MFMNQTKPFVKYLVVITFLIMITVNALANILPINGITTGEVAERYPNLFTPAAFTFAIWGLIYLLLAFYTLYQLGFFQRNRTIEKTKLLNQVGVCFSISSLVNALWIFAWHYQMIPLTMALMIILLFCLIIINLKINRVQLTKKERFFIKLPFGVYFGWITIATIANATALLVDLGWEGFGVSAVIWTVIVLLIGAVIGIATMLKFKDMAYGFVLIWAYWGILAKHVSANGFDGQYPTIIFFLIICLISFIITEARFFSPFKKNFLIGK